MGIATLPILRWWSPERGLHHWRVVLTRTKCGSRLLRVEDGLDLDGDPDAVSDHDTTALERGIEAHAEVVTVDFTRRGEADAGAAPRVLGEAVQLQLEKDGLGHALECEIALEEVLGTVGPNA